MQRWHPLPVSDTTVSPLPSHGPSLGQSGLLQLHLRKGGSWQPRPWGRCSPASVWESLLGQ